MRLRVARKVWRDEHEFREPGTGVWGFHKKSTLRRAERKLNRKDRFVLLPPEVPDLSMADVLARFEARPQPLMVVSPEVHAAYLRTFDAGRPPGGVAILVAKPGAPESAVDVTHLVAPEMLEEASRLIRETCSRPYSIEGVFAGIRSSEKQ